MKILGRKGETESGEFVQILSFIFNLGIIFIGIFIMITLFFGSDYEFRKIDSDVLLLNLVNCIEKNDIDFNNLQGEIISKCRLNEKVINQSYLVIIEKDNSRMFELGKGDSVQCGLSEKNIEYLKCSNRTLIKGIEGANSEIFIQTGSNQRTEEKIG